MERDEQSAFDIEQRLKHLEARCAALWTAFIYFSKHVSASEQVREEMRRMVDTLQKSGGESVALELHYLRKLMNELGS